eukprot:4932709-Pyramimonas_sp.AAC.1
MEAGAARGARGADASLLGGLATGAPTLAARGGAGGRLPARTEFGEVSSFPCPPIRQELSCLDAPALIRSAHRAQNVRVDTL